MQHEQQSRAVDVAPRWSWDAPPPERPGPPAGSPRHLAGGGAPVRSWPRIHTAVDLVVVSACVAFVLWQLQPGLLVSSTTPAGGDMGAHVWGPAFLRDELLPRFQLTGWSPDWYAGFPAFHFYMVVPALLVVVVNAGVQGWLALVPATVGVGLAGVAWQRRHQPGLRRGALAASAGAFALAGLSYGVAFKWVSVSGLLALPVAAYVFGRLGDLRFPTPALLAVATLPFLFYRGFTILGGNIASTLAGEFAYSISLSLALVYLGVVLRGLRTGEYRALAAVLLALIGLTHLIVAFWALGATAVIVAVGLLRTRDREGEDLSEPLASGAAAGAGAPPLPRPGPIGGGPGSAGAQGRPPGGPDGGRGMGPAPVLGDPWAPGAAGGPERDGPDPAPRPAEAGCAWCFGAGLSLVGVALLVGPGFGMAEGTVPMALAALGLAAVVAGLRSLTQSRIARVRSLALAVRWLTPVMVVGGLLSAFWVLPFYLRRAFMNDMGWEKLPTSDETLWQHLLPSSTADVDLRWVFALALVGAGLSLALRLRTGLFLVLSTAAVAVAFVLLPEGRLWNGRILPFYYLTAMLLAGLAVSETVRMIAAVVRGDGRRVPPRTGLLTAPLSLLVTLVVVGVPLGNLPFTERSDDSLAWPDLSPWQVRSEQESFIPAWAQWNYSGFEAKDAFPEYRSVVQTMQGLGRDPDHGCGRAFWEFQPELDRFGTPMALMLLPHWTDGCIGSMEGLFFESSATTPFHFLTQVELSADPSAAQRDLPYGGFDIDRGVAHLQLLGVRYYLTTSEQATGAARQHPDLTEVAATPPWVVFAVADSELVEPLAFEPAVLDGVGDHQADWLEGSLDADGRFDGPAVRWFTDPSRWEVPLASSGSPEWQRVGSEARPAARPVEAAVVSGIRTDTDRISFEVDRVGSPVLVKASYFPNWQAVGADGPYRVTPNLMVVVPTDQQVELRYGRTGVEWLSYALTGAGIVGLVLLVRRPVSRRLRPPEPRPR